MNVIYVSINKYFHSDNGKCFYFDFQQWVICLHTLFTFTCVITNESFNSFFLPGDGGGCLTSESFTPRLVRRVDIVSMDDQVCDSDLEEWKGGWLSGAFQWSNKNTGHWEHLMLDPAR